MKRYVLVGCLLISCTSGEGRSHFGTTRPLHGDDEIWINNSTEPEWLDPGLISGSVGSEIAQNIFAGLIDLHPKTLEVQPEIARAYTVSDGGKRYVFELRPTVWSDGVPLTAHDFEWSWKRVLDPATGSKYASLLYFFEGAKAYHSKKGPAEAVGIRALDDHHLEVRLTDPLPFFLSALSYASFLPVPRHVLEALERRGESPDLWTRPENIVSNGPYLLKEWRFRQYMVFRRNPRYWEASQVRTETIRLSMVDSYNTTLNLYKAGEIDWNGANAALPSEFTDHLKTFRDYRNDPKLAVYWYWVNTKKPPLDDVRVREALSLAIDREALVKHVLRAGQQATADFIPDGLAGYRGLGNPTYDPERARALLAEAGFPGGKAFPSMDLSYNTAESHKQIAEAIQGMWKKELGIQIGLENQEWKVYLKNLKILDFDLARLGWNGDYPDPYTFLEVFTEGNGNNHSGWSDPAYEALLSAANAARDPALRLAKLREAEALLVRAKPAIPLYFYTRPHMVKPHLMGLWGNFMTRHPWRYMWIDGRWRDGPPATVLSDEPPPVRAWGE